MRTAPAAWMEVSVIINVGRKNYLEHVIQDYTNEAYFVLPWSKKWSHCVTSSPNPMMYKLKWSHDGFPQLIPMWIDHLSDVFLYESHPILSDNPASASAVSTAANSILTSSSMASAASTLAAVAATNNSTSSSSSVITSQSNSTDLFGGGKGFNLDHEDQFRCGNSDKCGWIVDTS